MKKAFGDIINLHMCSNNYDQMMYGSSDMVRGRLIVISYFGLFFYPFTPPPPPSPLTDQKINILNNSRKHWQKSSFYISVSKIMIR